MGGGLALLKESMLVTGGGEGGGCREIGTQGDWQKEKVFFLIGGFGIVWG